VTTSIPIGAAHAPPLDAPRPVVVAGPTAAGKTEAALAIARRWNGELIGADSVQVYRGFDLGSAKPTAEELGGVPHHLIDVLDPDQDIDAQRYAALADAAIADVHRRGRLPIVVGGTGLWLRALLRGLVPAPPVDLALRARLDAEAERAGSPALHRRLAAVDPRAAAAIHPNDRLRIVRALEVFEQTGRPLGELRHEHALGGPRYDALFVVLDPGPALEHRIETRLDAMLASGWLDEVRALRARWGAVRPLGSVGYKELVEHLEAGTSMDQTRRAIRKATRIYARRQRTWFRSEPGVSLRTTAAALAEVGGVAEVEAHLQARRADASAPREARS
jgi:tRNA dimethylallyltransferase